MQQRDRRDALKLLAGGAAVAGATLIQTSTVFADGGTTSRRPPCTNSAGEVIWQTTAAHMVNINITDAQLNVDPVPTCAAGWTYSTQVAFLVNNDHEVRTLGGTVLASVGGTFGAFVDMPGNTMPVVMTGINGGPIVDGDTARLDVMMRRVCTRTSNSAKAWCCAAFKYVDVYVYGTPDTWGGSFSASTGSGKLDQTVADGCTAP